MVLVLIIFLEAARDGLLASLESMAGWAAIAEMSLSHVHPVLTVDDIGSSKYL